MSGQRPGRSAGSAGPLDDPRRVRELAVALATLDPDKRAQANRAVLTRLACETDTQFMMVLAQALARTRPWSSRSGGGPAGAAGAPGPPRRSPQGAGVGEALPDWNRTRMSARRPYRFWGLADTPRGPSQGA